MMKAQPTRKISTQETLRFAAMVEERLGLHFPENRRGDLVAALAAGQRAANLDSLTAYLRMLAAPGNKPEWDSLASFLSVGETHFFRNGPQFTALTEHVLPQLIARRSSERTLNIWSAGCSTGEEPYSIAVALRHSFPQLGGWRINILASDIDREAIALAVKGRYGPRSLRETDPAIRDRYFRPDGTGSWALSDEIKQMVNFQQVNLADPVFPVAVGQMDLIICRNVTIYFPERLTQRLIQQFYHSLQAGGWLMVGPAEANLNTYRSFTVHSFAGATLYQRAENGQGRADQLQALPPAPSHDPVEGAPPSHPTNSEDGKERERTQIAALREAEMYASRARSSADRGQMEDARYWSEKAIALNPLAADAYITLGLVLTDLGELDSALQTLKRALFVNREYLAAHVLLGDLHMSTGRTALARRNWQNALELVQARTPDNAVPDTGGMTCAQLQAVLEQRLHQ